MIRFLRLSIAVFRASLPASMKRFFLILAYLCGGFYALAQDAPAPGPPPASSTIPDDASRVAVLGYHDFSETAKETAMRIHTSKFRKQMETIRRLGIPVISLEDFLAWKRGEKSIPEKSILLTFDDGWKSVYTDAFPILKEFGYPFTLYLYKDYVDGGGRALSSPMVQEMLKSGASIGSHSVSHPYPHVFKSYHKKGPDANDAFLRKEIGESKRFLEAQFGLKVTTYAYPGGYYTDEMLPLAKEFGYTELFTVIPGKVKRSTADITMPRYMILGNYDKVFELATTFREGRSTESTVSLAGTPQPTPCPVSPESGAIINSRLPEISADLSKVANIDPSKLVMKISGFGEVPANFNSKTGKFSWQVNRRLRQPTCQVSVTWKDTAGKAAENPLRWSFQIDRTSSYLPDEEK